MFQSLQSESYLQKRKEDRSAYLKKQTVKYTNKKSILYTGAGKIYEKHKKSFRNGE